MRSLRWQESEAHNQRPDGMAWKDNRPFPGLTSPQAAIQILKFVSGPGWFLSVLVAQAVL